MHFGARASIESFAIVVRCVTLYICIAWLGWGLAAYSLAQVALTLELIVAYYGLFIYTALAGRSDYGITRVRQLFPHKVDSSKP